MRNVVECDFGLDNTTFSPQKRSAVLGRVAATPRSDVSTICSRAIYCTSASPQISSIEFDAENEGRMAPAAFLVEQAVKYISENATKGIDPGDVADHLGHQPIWRSSCRGPPFPAILAAGTGNGENTPFYTLHFITAQNEFWPEMRFAQL